jgi:hypothetical protein
VDEIVVRFEGEEETRDADRDRPDQREMAGKEEKRHARDPYRHGEEQRIRRLGDEKTGDALHVVDDPPPFGHHAGQAREAAVEQHELGDGPARIGSVAHGDSHVGVLEGEHVVDAVARHRDSTALLLQGAHHGSLLLRGDAAEHREALDGDGDGIVVGEGVRVDPVDVDEPGPTRHGSDGDGVVARDHLHRHLLLAEPLQGDRGVGAYDVFEHGEGGRARARELAVARQIVGASQEQHPVPGARMLVDASADRLAVDAGPQQDLGCPEHPGADAVECRRTPFTGRRERDDFGGGEVRRAEVGQGAQRRIGVGVRRAQRCEDLTAQVVVVAVDHVECVERDLARRDRAGLVDTQHIDARQCLHRRQLLHEGAASGQAQHAEGEGHTRE